MEIEKRKVEIDQIDLGYYLTHILYMVLPCGYADLMVFIKLKENIME